MKSSSNRIKEFFARTLERKAPAEREEYLSEVCRADPELRAEVESLLRAGEQAGDFLRPTIKVTESDFVSEKAGTMIGRYKLLEQIGEGGEASRWRARLQDFTARLSSKAPPR